MRLVWLLVAGCLAISVAGKHSGPLHLLAYGEKPEAFSVCLREYEFEFCPEFQGGTFGLTYCHDAHDSSPVLIGKCGYASPEAIGGSVNVTDTLQVFAKIEATCTFTQQSHHIGHPFSEDLELKIIGAAYSLNNAVVASLGDQPTLVSGSNLCANNTRVAKGLTASTNKPAVAAGNKTQGASSGSPAAGVVQVSPSSKKDKHPYSSSKHYGYDGYDPYDGYGQAPRTLIEVSRLSLQFGHMVVVNRRTQAVEYEVGLFKRAFAYDAPTRQITEAELHGREVQLTPFTNRFTFIRH